MSKKVPVVVHADPDVETTITIKPFAAGLAKPVSFGGDQADGHTGTASATATPQGNDADADYDYSG